MIHIRNTEDRKLLLYLLPQHTLDHMEGGVYISSYQMLLVILALTNPASHCGQLPETLQCGIQQFDHVWTVK